MVLDLIDPAGATGANYALDFIAQVIEEAPRAKPWVLVEPRSSKFCLYPPAFTRSLRQAMSDKKILWVQSSDELCPKIALHWLSSSLCEGVLLHRLDKFSKAIPAAVWTRRWQLAGKKTKTHFVWLHEKDTPVIGFDLRLAWENANPLPLVRKGHHIYEKLKRTAA